MLADTGSLKSPRLGCELLGDVGFELTESGSLRGTEPTGDAVAEEHGDSHRGEPALKAESFASALPQGVAGRLTSAVAGTAGAGATACSLPHTERAESESAVLRTVEVANESSAVPSVFKSVGTGGVSFAVAAEPSFPTAPGVVSGCVGGEPASPVALWPVSASAPFSTPIGDGAFERASTCTAPMLGLTGIAVESLARSLAGHCTGWLATALGAASSGAAFLGTASLGAACLEAASSAAASSVAASLRAASSAAASSVATSKAGSLASFSGAASLGAASFGAASLEAASLGAALLAKLLACKVPAFWFPVPRSLARLSARSFARPALESGVLMPTFESAQASTDLADTAVPCLSGLSVCSESLDPGPASRFEVHELWFWETSKALIATEVAAEVVQGTRGASPRASASTGADPGPVDVPTQPPDVPRASPCSRVSLVSDPTVATGDPSLVAPPSQEPLTRPIAAGRVGSWAAKPSSGVHVAFVTRSASGASIAELGSVASPGEAAFQSPL